MMIMTVVVMVGYFPPPVFLKFLKAFLTFSFAKNLLTSIQM